MSLLRPSILTLCAVAMMDVGSFETPASRSHKRSLTTNCPAAVPDDGVNDREAIQNCFDAPGASEVILVPGVYDIEEGIRLRSDDLLLTSIGGKATLRATPALAFQMIYAAESNYFEISELIVDGNRGSRSTSVLDTICTNSNPNDGSNIVAEGSGFVIHHVDTINAACGSGLVANGDNFEVYSVYSADNGQEAVDGGPNEYWADGITSNRCTSGYIHDNVSKNNTDVGIVVHRGSNCRVRFNQVVNDARHAFSGMNIAAEDVGDGVGFSGSVVSDNVITSGYNLMGMGMSIGFHMWENTPGADAAEIRYNTISGAVTNMVIDGIANGTITDNTLSNAQGNRHFNPACPYTGNLTYGDKGNATVQVGGVCMIRHDGCGCQ